jgi:hypothetical protein
MPKLFGGGGSKQKSSGGGGAGGGAAAAAKALFSPEQVTKNVADYKTQGGAKWNQILANMGAGGGTGGDVTGTISSQADQFGKALSGLTDQSGYGSDPTAQMQQILKSVEGGITPKYSVYG